METESTHPAALSGVFTNRVPEVRAGVPCNTRALLGDAMAPENVAVPVKVDVPDTVND